MFLCNTICYSIPCIVNVGIRMMAENQPRRPVGNSNYATKPPKANDGLPLIITYGRQLPPMGSIKETITYIVKGEKHTIPAYGLALLKRNTTFAGTNPSAMHPMGSPAQAFLARYREYRKNRLHLPTYTHQKPLNNKVASPYATPQSPQVKITRRNPL